MAERAENAGPDRIQLISAEYFGGDVRDAIMMELQSGPLRNYVYADLKEDEQRKVESRVREFAKQLCMRISQVARSLNVTRVPGEIRGVTLTEGGKLNLRLRAENSDEAWGCITKLRNGPVLLLDLTSYNLEAEREPWAIRRDQGEVFDTPVAANGSAGTETAPSERTAGEPGPGEPDMQHIDQVLNGNGADDGGEPPDTAAAKVPHHVATPERKARGRRAVAH
jgi:hypothetical protein